MLNSDLLLQYSPQGLLLRRFELGNAGNIGGGLTYDGKHLYLLDYTSRIQVAGGGQGRSGNGAIYRWGQAGGLVKVLDLPADQANTFGLTDRQGSLYYGHSPTVRDSATIYQITLERRLVEFAKTNFYVRGLASQGESFWVSTTKTILRVDHRFSVLETYLPQVEVGDLTWAKDHLWALEHSKNRLHRFSIPPNAEAK